AALAALAGALDAPVVQTTNARGLMHGAPLAVPASPSLAAVRALIDAADAVLAIGTELGPTDYDMYARGGPALPEALVRVDICPDQIARHPCRIGIAAEAGAALAALAAALPAGAARSRDGAARAGAARSAARAELEPEMAAQLAVLEAIRDAVPGAICVGDSTQPIYAGNLFHDHDRPGGWFNAATGFGALGYGIPAAIGAQIACPEAPVICIAGDGGAQFTLPELMAAVQERLPIVFVIWNNRGYREIEMFMRADGIAPVGCDPLPPGFAGIAGACGIAHRACAATPAAVAAAVGAAMAEARVAGGPRMVEIEVA
ncbi:thiamine pyrophosphate-dependent enzyme, partial [Paralimibaculum aggregatum]|uniref:thiamine pyrophosphate-dependent enzyme n=1 Tax=Paralimibaculum aggregatum TaxID=3036245 RepID=UPI002554A933